MRRISKAGAVRDPFSAEPVRPHCSLRMATPEKPTGADTPEDQRILLRLSEGDLVGYRLENPENQKIRIHVRSYGDGILDVQDLTAGQGLVWVSCSSGIINVENLHITIEE